MATLAEVFKLRTISAKNKAKAHLWWCSLTKSAQIWSHLQQFYLPEIVAMYNNCQMLQSRMTNRAARSNRENINMSAEETSRNDSFWTRWLRETLPKSFRSSRFRRMILQWVSVRACSKRSRKDFMKSHSTISPACKIQNYLQLYRQGPPLVRPESAIILRRANASTLCMRTLTCKLLG